MGHRSLQALRRADEEEDDLDALATRSAIVDVTERDDVRVELIDRGAPAMRPFSASLPMALLRAREAAMRRFRPMLAEHDLTEQQWRVLRALSSAGEPLDAGELADRTYLLAPSLSRILANLSDRTLIERRPDHVDQRRSLISLTHGGRALVAVVAPRSERGYEAIEAEFGAERLQRLLHDLHDLAALDELTRDEQEAAS